MGQLERDAGVAGGVFGQLGAGQALPSCGLRISLCGLSMGACGALTAWET